MSSKIVQSLLERELLTLEQVEEAEGLATERGVPLLKVLMDTNVVPEDALFRLVAETVGMPFVDPGALTVDQEATGLIPAAKARKSQVLPFAWHKGKLMVAISNPVDIALRDDVTAQTRVPVTFCLAPPRALAQKISQVYRPMQEMGTLSDEIVSDLGGSSLEDQIASLGDTGGDSDAPVIKFVDLMISQAVSDGASDIHVDPAQEHVVLRYRVDGVLQEQSRVPLRALSGIVSRLKVMGRMDIAEKRKPQDGRATVTVDGKKVDLRIAVLPTVFGEKVVMRILDQALGMRDLGSLGLSKRNLERYRSQYTLPNGMILVTGPTGSGKSTTLYSTLNEVMSPEINIITTEDPVEFRIGGISQVQINPKSGLTFAAALRSILRADPDVVLVGEIRDRETAQIAIEAALTGHLVLSSLHTNDAPSAATRLVEMGVEPFLVGAALRSVVAQRLVRRLCSHCKVAYTLTDKELESLSLDWSPTADGAPTFYKPADHGCSHCNNTGYKGRLPLHEVMIVKSKDPEHDLERLINENEHTNVLRAAAIAGGMTPLKQDGLHKAYEGLTSIQEVLRVAG